MLVNSWGRVRREEASPDKTQSLELHLSRLRGALSLLSVVGFHFLASSESYVLLLIESGPAFIVHESVVNIELLSGMRLELDHLFDGYSVAVAATV